MIRLIKLIIWIVVISGGVFFLNYSSYETTILTQEETTLEVDGGGFQSVLIDAGASPLFTKLYLRENTPNFQLQKGKYVIPANADVVTYLESLKNPINEDDIFFRSLEGWNIFDIDLCLSSPESTISFNEEKNQYQGCIFNTDGPIKSPLINAGDFISFAENHSLASEYVFLDGIDSLEGYLYPDTYAINPNNFSIEILARKMLDNFNTKIFQGYLSHADNQTIFELITLASIVEKEERNDNEKPTVAGILKKRLDEGWQIGADITVCYPFRLTAEECKLSVTKYLYEVNDYNTRQKVGLPAGPIGNPSEVTIKATLFPKQTSYYYYLHDTLTGQIYYGETNADHERNKALYLR